MSLLIRTVLGQLVDIVDTNEILCVGNKLSMVLEQEPMRGVGIDLDLRGGISPASK